MKRDQPRNRMAPNSAWNIVDMILDYGAPARERGGWAHASNSITAVTASTTYARAGLFAVFSPTAGADPQNVVVGDNGTVFKIAQDGTVTKIDDSLAVAQNPVFHGGTAASAATAVYTGLVIIPTASGAPRKYDGTTLSLLGGSPPSAKYAAVYRDYTCLANGTLSSIAYPNRLWFSPAGDPDAGFSGAQTAWDTTDSWIDFSLPIEGIAATKTALLVFHQNQISRIRGNNPPPDEDMVVDDPFVKIGLLDPFSLTEHEELIYWCAPEGVYRTDGVSVDNMALKGGMLRYWLDLQVDATTAWTYATGVIRDNLIVTIMNGTTFVDAFVISLSNYAWSRISNLDAIAFWSGLYGASDEEFFARRNLDKIGRMDTIFQVGDSTYKNDGGTAATASPGTAKAVASVLETPFYELGRPGLKVVKRLFAGYSLVDFASDNPAITAAYATSPESETYTDLGSLAEQSAYARQALTIGGRMYGISFKFTRGGAGDFFGYDIAVEQNPLEESKR